MITRRLFAFALCFLFALLPRGPLQADPVDDLFDALRLDRIVAVMSDEGIAYGAQISADMLAGRGGEEWSQIVKLIYDEAWMAQTLRLSLRTALEGTDVGPMTAFFEAEPARTINGFETAARESFLDEMVSEAAEDAAAAASGSGRMAQIRRYIDANDLIEANVSGALNANVAFYIGLVEGGAFDFTLTEEQILSDVWAREPEIRENTTKWLESFLYLAYSPVSDADLETYIDFSQTEAGQALNAALFEAFDIMFEDVSRALGLGAARFLGGEEL